MKTARGLRRAFTTIELLVVIAILAILIALLVPALVEARRGGRLGVCMSNTAQYARATPAYIADFKDAIWAFSWKSGNASSQYPDLRGATQDTAAAADQAVDILRTRADRSDMPRMTNWIPHPMYTHLVLVDYLSAKLPEPVATCPEDRQRLLWRADPRGFDSGAVSPSPSMNAGPSQTSRWPYSASYQVPDCTFDASPVGHRVYQAPNACDGRFVSPTNQLGGLRLAAVQYPAQKVHVYDRHQRHFSRRQPFFGLQLCRQPVLMFDGSVALRSTSAANPGWQPNNPSSPDPTIVQYQPEPWDPAAFTSPRDEGPGVYRWTRGGLAGVDFGGREINTGQLPR
jgi:prepilin-type N-terminal cleavage/methylation domain-containing protein